MSDAYTPIDCGFYDRVEAAAMRRTSVVLELTDGTSVTARILDVGAKEGADWAEVEGVGPVRLDRIAVLDGVARPEAASCAVAGKG